jgi:transposase
MLRAGCAWRLLPHDFPRWKTVYHYWRAWRLSGLWERTNAILAALRKLPQAFRDVVVLTDVEEFSYFVREDGLLKACI